MTHFLVHAKFYLVMKKLFLLILAFLSLPVFCAGKEKLTVGLLNGPSSIPAAYLIENTSDYEFQIFSGADLEIPKLLKGEIDLAVLPPNAAAKLWNKNGKNVVVLAVIGEGNISLFTTDPDYKNLESLKGKTVYCAGRGATPDYMFRYILEKKGVKVSENGPSPDAVFLDFQVPNAEIAGTLISGKADYILVPEPFGTVALMKGKSFGVKKVCNLSDEYDSKNYPLTVLVANKKSLDSKKTAVKKYLKDYEKAVTWTLENATSAGALVEKHTLGLTASITASSIPCGNYVFIPADQARPEMEKLLNIFFERDPDSIGGKLPGEDFYQK